MNHCTYDSQHEPKNIKVQGLHGRWDVCLHAVEKNGSREYWWVRNANGVDGEEGYWTTRNTAGEYKYFCDAGWGDDAVYEAYCDGRKAPVTDVEIEAAAKYLKANPGLFGPSACFIDPNRFEEIARSVLQAARNAVGKDME